MWYADEYAERVSGRDDWKALWVVVVSVLMIVALMVGGGSGCGGRRRLTCSRRGVAIAIDL